MVTSTQLSCVPPVAAEPPAGAEAPDSWGALVGAGAAGGAPMTISGSIVRSCARTDTAAVIVIVTDIAKIAALMCEAPSVAGLSLQMVTGETNINIALPALA